MNVGPAGNHQENITATKQSTAKNNHKQQKNGSNEFTNNQTDGGRSPDPEYTCIRACMHVHGPYRHTSRCKRCKTAHTLTSWQPAGRGGAPAHTRKTPVGGALQSPPHRSAPQPRCHVPPTSRPPQKQKSGAFLMYRLSMWLCAAL